MSLCAGHSNTRLTILIIICGWRAPLEPDRKSELESHPADLSSRGDSTQDNHGRRAGSKAPRADEPRLVVAFVSGRPLLEGLCISLAKADEAWIVGGRARSVVPHDRKIVVKLEDRAISRRHVQIRRVVRGWELADRDSKNGTFVNGRLLRRTTLVDGDVIEIGQSILIFRDEGSAAVGLLGPEIRGRDVNDGSSKSLVFRTLIGELERMLFDLARFARSQVAVLVRGETGTGKELVARAMHELSGRDGQIIAINCGALSRGLVESELFGSQRGAYTGAREARVGLVRSAHRGTLFLDEIGDLAKDSQAALLRVLQEREVTPVGASRPVAVDIQVVAATHQDLDAMIRDGRFRQDLYTRLTGFEFALPPLRERREDVGILMSGILRRRGGDAMRLTFSGEAARALLTYPYPGNIRELEQALVAAAVLTGGGHVEAEHLPVAIKRHGLPHGRDLEPKEHEIREQLLDLMREKRGNVSAVARAMSKAPVQIRRWCTKFAIDPDTFRGADS
jgi:transcriptional regulator with AAA-type ATPase domain